MSLKNSGQIAMRACKAMRARQAVVIGFDGEGRFAISVAGADGAVASEVVRLYEEAANIILSRALTVPGQSEDDAFPIVPYTFPCASRVSDLARLTVDDIDEHRIANGLANVCRYSGQVRPYYSVAEHSILVASIVPSEYQLAALLHDSSEGLGLSDLLATLKRLLPMYQAVERRVMAPVEAWAGLKPGACSHPIIKAADRAVYLAEQRDLRGIDLSVLPDFEKSVEPASVHFHRYSPDDAGAAWLRAYQYARHRVGPGVLA